MYFLLGFFKRKFHTRVYIVDIRMLLSVLCTYIDGHGNNK